MQTLILMRHGKAVREHEAASDKARGLTDRGRREAHAAAAALAEFGLRPQAALVSSAQRTRETFEAAAPAFPGLTPVHLDQLYMAEADTIFDAAAASGAQTVLVVGHNPGLNDLAALLIERSGERTRAALSLSEHLPTAAIAAFRVDGEGLDDVQAQVAFLYAPER